MFPRSRHSRWLFLLLFSMYASAQCTYEVQPNFFDVPTIGVSSALRVVTQPGCAWTIPDPPEWLTFSERSGTGTTVVNVEFQPFEKPDATRETTIYIENSYYVVRQRGGGPSPTCTKWVVSPTYFTGISPAGASGEVKLDVGPDCTWNATSPMGLTISPTGGVGPATIKWTSSMETAPGPGYRGLRIGLNDVPIFLDPLPVCSGKATLDRTSWSVPWWGASGLVVVTEPKRPCYYTVQPLDPWVSTAEFNWVVPSYGLKWTVTSNTGFAPRTGRLDVGGTIVEFTQGGYPCPLSLTPTEISFPSTGGNGSIQLVTNSGCAWVVKSAHSDVTLSKSSGTGPATIDFQVKPNLFNSKLGVAVNAGLVNDPMRGAQMIIYREAPDCSYSITPNSLTLPQAGGSAKFRVVTGTGCAWQFITMGDTGHFSLSATSGTGETEVTVSASTNQSAFTRYVLVEIGMNRLSIGQPGVDCAVELSPTSVSLSGLRESGTIQIKTNGPACPWTASSSVDWLEISATSGTGSGSLTFEAAPNFEGAARQGGLNISGKTVSLTQQTAECTVTLDQSEIRASEQGGAIGTYVRANPEGCPWTVTGLPSWIRFSPPSYPGTGSLHLNVDSNYFAPPRSAILRVRSRTLTVRQDGCVVQVSPSSAEVTEDGSSVPINVTTNPEGCKWTLVASDHWLYPEPLTGNGTGTAVIHVRDNGMPTARVGRVSAGPASVEIRQKGTQNCSFTLAPETVTVSASGGTGTFRVIASEDNCDWALRSDAAPLNFTPSSGKGSVEVRYAAGPNPFSEPRELLAFVADKRLTFQQAGRVEETASLVVEPQTELRFAARFGDGAVPTQNVRLRNTGQREVQYNSRIQFEGKAWLTVEPSAGTAPGGNSAGTWIALKADLTGIEPGTHRALITFLPQGEGDGTQLAARLDMSADAQPSIVIETPRLDFRSQDPMQAQEGTLILSNPSSQPVEATLSVVPEAAKWLTIAGETNVRISRSSPAVVQVKMDPADLQPGSHEGQIAVKSGESRLSIPVTVLVTATEAPSQPESNFVELRFQEGGNAPVVYVPIRGGELESMAVRLAVGAPEWLATWPANTDEESKIGITARPEVMKAGLHAGLIVLGDRDGKNSILVHARVEQGPVTAGVKFAPPWLLLRAEKRQAHVGGELRVVGDDAELATYKAVFVPAPGEPAFAAVLLGAQPGQLRVEATPENLEAGTYRGSVELRFEDGSTAQAPINLIIEERGGVCAEEAGSLVLLSHGRLVKVNPGMLVTLRATVVDKCGTVLDRPIHLRTKAGTSYLFEKSPDGNTVLVWNPSEAEVNEGSVEIVAAGLEPLALQIEGAGDGSFPRVRTWNWLDNDRSILVLEGQGFAKEEATSDGWQRLGQTVVWLGDAALGLLRVSPTRIEAKLPAGTLPGLSGDIVVEYDGRMSTPIHLVWPTP